jgi:hypothetical protein
MITKAAAKKVLGELPLTAEVYWHLRQGGKPPRTGFKLEQLQEHLPVMLELRSTPGEYIWEEYFNLLHAPFLDRACLGPGIGFGSPRS